MNKLIKIFFFFYYIFNYIKKINKIILKKSRMNYYSIGIGVYVMIDFFYFAFIDIKIKNQITLFG